MSSSERRASNRAYFQQHAAEILGGPEAEEKAKDLHQAKFDTKLTESIEEFLTGLFRSPEAQRIVRELEEMGL